MVPVTAPFFRILLDPVLKARAEIAPPTAFVALEDGKAVSQKPFDRTHHAISRPEVLPDTHEPLTLAEESFINELEERMIHAEESN